MSQTRAQPCRWRAVSCGKTRSRHWTMGEWRASHGAQCSSYSLCGTRGRGSSGPPRATPPERAESCAMPAKNGRGLDEQDCVTPSWRHSRREDNHEALPGSPPNTTGELPLCDDKLLTKKRVLRDQVYAAAN